MHSYDRTLEDLSPWDLNEMDEEGCAFFHLKLVDKEIEVEAVT